MLGIMLTGCKSSARKITIRRTGLHFTFYDVHEKATLPHPQTGEVGDVALWKGCPYVLELDKSQKLSWIKAEDGYAYPRHILPEHELAIRAGKAPAWVKGSSKPKSRQRSVRNQV